MIDFSTVREGDRIEYIGDSFAYGGFYTVYLTEKTYKNPVDCPKSQIGKLLIVEFMNDDTPMFFPLTMLNPNDWKSAHREIDFGEPVGKEIW